VSLSPVSKYKSKVKIQPLLILPLLGFREKLGLVDLEADDVKLELGEVEVKFPAGVGVGDGVGVGLGPDKSLSFKY
jgi:hypothetical protein